MQSLTFIAVVYFSSGTVFGMKNLDKKIGNTGVKGKYFWRIEDRDRKDGTEKCFTWVSLQQDINFFLWYVQRVRSDRRMACPCTAWQASRNRGRFFWDWQGYNWPKLCFRSFRRKYFYYYSVDLGIVIFRTTQLCCYSTNRKDWGALKIGTPDGGHISVEPIDVWSNRAKEVFSDRDAHTFCCVDTPLCDLFYLYRPADNCRLYRPPRTRKFSLCF